MKYFWLLTGVLSVVAATSVLAATPDATYVTIYQLIQEGDAFRRGENPAEASAKFREARQQLRTLQSDHPSWNPAVVRFRLNYLDQQIAELASATPLAEKQPDPLERNIPTVGTSREQLDRLRTRIQQLEQEKSHLEARLIEALKAQPAAVDPRELERAEARLQEMQKENELLRVELANAESRIGQLTVQVADASALEKASETIEEQAAQLSMLELEKEALQNRLTNLMREKSRSTAVDAGQDQSPTVDLSLREDEEQQARVALLEAANQIQRQQRELDRLREERDALQSQVADLTQATNRLESEKRALVRELDELKGLLNNQTDLAVLNRQLIEARTQLAAATVENEALRSQNLDLAEQVDQLEDAQVQAVGKTQQLEAQNDSKAREIDDLRNQLIRLESQLEQSSQQRADKRKTKERSQLVALENEIVLLKSRLEVLEAQKVPYSPEELALFEEPAESEASERGNGDEPSDTRQSGLKTLPPGAGPLVANARRAFARGRLEEAEENYLQVLQLDDTNVFTLANLAAIQIEQGNFETAESTLKKALELQPQDSYSLTLMGILKFRQERFDEAYKVLTRSAEIDPDNADTQNYLGITLSQKGLRGPAEVALRKAVRLAPGNPTAHYNLAVVYASQTPPFTALADWHYQKAIANGHPRNDQLENLIGE